MKVKIEIDDEVHYYGETSTVVYGVMAAKDDTRVHAAGPKDKMVFLIQELSWRAANKVFIKR